MFRKCLLLLSVLCMAGIANGVTVVNETFTDGSRTDGSPLAWYATESPIVTVANDATIGGGNAMSVTTLSTSTSINRRIAANFAQQSLTNVGDKISLSLDFRFSNNASTGTNVSRAFKVGLFNNNGTSLTADLGNTAEPTSSTTNALSNDQGYAVGIGWGNTASTGSTTLYKENGVGATFMGGTDLDYYQGTSNYTPHLFDSLKHTVLFTITKDSATTLKLDFVLDGALDGNLIDLTSGGGVGLTGYNSPTLFTTFNEIGIANGANGTGFVVDNIKVEFTSVPEPATLAILGLGGLVIRRRMRA